MLAVDEVSDTCRAQLTVSYGGAPIQVPTGLPLQFTCLLTPPPAHLPALASQLQPAEVPAVLLHQRRCSRLNFFSTPELHTCNCSCTPLPSSLPLTCTLLSPLSPAVTEWAVADP